MTCDVFDDNEIEETITKEARRMLHDYIHKTPQNYKIAIAEQEAYETDLIVKAYEYMLTTQIKPDTFDWDHELAKLDGYKAKLDALRFFLRENLPQRFSRIGSVRPDRSRSRCSGVASTVKDGTAAD